MGQRTCGEAGCSAKHYAKGQCKKHRAQTYRAELVGIECSHCGCGFKGKRWHTDAAHQRRYCTPECQADAKSWRYRTVFSVKIPWRDCLDCGVRFIGRGGVKRCDGCRYRPAGCWHMGWCARCGEPFVDRNRQARYCTRRCLKKHARDKRDAQARATRVEDVSRSKVYERDEWMCQLCGEAVDREAQVPNDWAPTLDHIIPLAQGGEHSYENVQLAHFRCNYLKSDSVPVGTQIRLALA